MIEALSTSQSFLFTSLTFLGLIIGSFLNVVAYRLPIILKAQWRRDCLSFLGEVSEKSKEVSLSSPSSHCPKCKIRIKPWENIPILSYIALRGNCSNCSEKINLRYPIIELLTALCTLYLGYLYGVSWELLAALVFTWSLITLSLIDLDHQLLPDDITIPLLWLGLVVNINSLFVPLESAIIGAILGYGLLWATYWIFKFVTGKEGMGFGDFKLLSALGGWLGWDALPMIVLLSSVAGVAVGIFHIYFSGHNKDVPIPFGPYLAIAGFTALILKSPR
jgi:Type II secretory pathway, prepilin signal peptidase PulO and related peptidases